MSSIVNTRCVLKLNKFWTAIGTTTPAKAFSDLMTGVVTALDVDTPTVHRGILIWIGGTHLTPPLFSAWGLPIHPNSPTLRDELASSIIFLPREAMLKDALASR